MISSEVQRTLVKSPPELWNELSDPDALARHLGELGEIKITRVEPENLVEWEAEGTTGTVEIKPSGWGTRVTLTVLRERSAAEPVNPGAAHAGAPEPPAFVHEDAEEDSDSAPEEGERPESSGADPAAEVEQAPGPVESYAPRFARDAAARRLGPATAAARRAAGWPSPAAPGGPAIESDLRAAEALDGPPAAPAGVQEWAAQAIEEKEPLRDAAEEPPAREQPPPEPRRGFFARLFGRRRRPGAEQPMAAAFASAEAKEPSERLAEIVEEDDARAANEAQGAFEEPPESADADCEADLVAPEGPITETEPQAADAVPQATESEPATYAAESDEPDVPPAAPDLSAELRAAEDVAAEKVEAVLTAVLDRLGAAHHRPFSRP